MKLILSVILTLCGLSVTVAAHGAEVGQWEVFETSFETTKPYKNPFVDVEVNVVFKQGKKQWTVPAFWAGAGKWTVRFAAPAKGQYKYRVECTDKSNRGLNGSEQTLSVHAYRGENPLLKHGFLKASKNGRHFEHADGTPFFWLGDTWWKNLCKRMTWKGFQELTADRKAKGFTLVQIVCGPYPDEGAFEPRWENEGGKPYETRNFTKVNPAYFDYADRRIKHLVDAGLVPAIVGGWGRSESMKAVGAAGYKRHWRHLVARYGAFPVVWILGGEAIDIVHRSQGPWTDVGRYLRDVDPYRHPMTVHPEAGISSGRRALREPAIVSYNMVGGNHDGAFAVTKKTLAVFESAYAQKPNMPVLCGETAYEGHMQRNFQPVQRHIFWMYMLSGAAGHTYGAAGVWHASVEGDPGITPVYDLTTWREGMNYPGSTQLGLGKKLLEQYPWWRFQPHSEWVESDSFAAGIPGEVRVVYQPRRGIYNWTAPVVKNLERDVLYYAFFFDPVRGKRHELGTIVNPGPPPRPFKGHAQPLLFSDKFDQADSSAWKDYGSASERKNDRLVGAKGMVTVLEKVSDTDLMASVDANSDAEAGVILRFHDPDNYLVALYSPAFKAIYIHDRKNGEWGDQLGHVQVPKIGPKIRLTAAACGDYAAVVLTDGKKTYHTPVVKVDNKKPGKVGLWLYQIGERQEYDNFKLSRAQFAPVKRKITELSAQRGAEQRKTPKIRYLPTSTYQPASLPSPQDWVLVLERVKR